MSRSCRYRKLKKRKYNNVSFSPLKTITLTIVGAIKGPEKCPTGASSAKTNQNVLIGQLPSLTRQTDGCTFVCHARP